METVSTNLVRKSGAGTHTTTLSISRMKKHGDEYPQSAATGYYYYDGVVRTKDTNTA